MDKGVFLIGFLVGDLLGTFPVGFLVGSYQAVLLLCRRGQMLFSGSWVVFGIIVVSGIVED